MSEYPKMLYSQDGQSRTVTSQDEENGLGSEWSSEVTDAFRASASVHSNASQVTKSGDEALADMIADRVVARLRDETATPDAEPPRRGPGRPPKTSI